MNRLAQFLTLIAGLILIIVLGFSRNGERPAEPPARKNLEARTSSAEGTGTAPSTPTPPPPGAGGSIEALLTAAALGDRPPGVLSGPFKVEGTAEAPDGLAELGLTLSQRAIIDALMADRDAKLREIRREVEDRAPRGADANRLCAEAARAQASCMASIRSSLFPEQLGRFDALIKSGRWGGYTLIIPR